MVVAVQAKRNMLWFQKRNFEFRNSSGRVGLGAAARAGLRRREPLFSAQCAEIVLENAENMAYNIRIRCG